MVQPKLRVWQTKPRRFWWLSLHRRLGIWDRHRFFCRGLSGEVLEECPVRLPWMAHDRYDGPQTIYFGVTLTRWLIFGRVIATARLVVGERHDLPTDALLQRMSHDGIDVHDDRTYSEPSRLGMLKQYQGTELGRNALLMLVGAIVDTSASAGYDNFLLTLRKPVVRSFNWFPWGQLEGPIGKDNYPPEEGGPLEGPVWLADVNLNDLAAATQLLRPSVFMLMFPHNLAWFDANKARPPEELREIQRNNQLVIKTMKFQHENGAPSPKTA